MEPHCPSSSQVKYLYDGSLCVNFQTTFKVKAKQNSTLTTGKVKAKRATKYPNVTANNTILSLIQSLHKSGLTAHTTKSVMTEEDDEVSDKIKEDHDPEGDKPIKSFFNDVYLENPQSNVKDQVPRENKKSL